MLHFIWMLFVLNSFLHSWLIVCRFILEGPRVASWSKHHTLWFPEGWCLCFCHHPLWNHWAERSIWCYPLWTQRYVVLAPQVVISWEVLSSGLDWCTSYPYWGSSCFFFFFNFHQTNSMCCSYFLSSSLCVILLSSHSTLNNICR